MTETHIGTRIRDARRARGLTQKQLAQELNIPVRTLRAYERNERIPDEKTLHRIADTLNFPAHFFLRKPMVSDVRVLFVCRLDDIFGAS
jgi:transcriptional regulator with XRE-family HTH domain